MDAMQGPPTSLRLRCNASSNDCRGPHDWTAYRWAYAAASVGARVGSAAAWQLLSGGNELGSRRGWFIASARVREERGAPGRLGGDFASQAGTGIRGQIDPVAVTLSQPAVMRFRCTPARSIAKCRVRSETAFVCDPLRRRVPGRFRHGRLICPMNSLRILFTLGAFFGRAIIDLSRYPARLQSSMRYVDGG